MLMKNKTIVRVGTRITKEENERLETIAAFGGFKSTYSLLKYILYCFLRATDRSNDQIQESLPIEIIQLFVDAPAQDAADIQKAILLIRQRRAWKEEKRRQRAQKRDVIADDIHDLFEECESEGIEREFAPNINKRL